MITILQTTGVQNVDSTIPPSITLSFPNPTSAGSLIVVAFSNAANYGLLQGTTPNGSLADNNNNAYTSVIEIDGGNVGDDNGGVEIDYLPAADAGITSISLTAGLVSSHPVHIYTFDSGGNTSAIAWEVSGTSSNPDITSSNDDTVAITGISPGTFTLAQANEFVVIVGSSGTNGNQIYDADPPFDVNFQTSDNLDGYSYIISSSVGPYTPNFDLNSGGTGALAAVVSFLGLAATTSFALDDSLGISFNSISSGTTTTTKF